MEDYSERIAQLLSDSRASAGVSRDHIAKAMGVSKKTIQNWESGYTSPTLKNVMEWFRIIDVPIYPFMLKISHPELQSLNANSTDEDVRKALLSLIKDMDITKMRQHFFEMFGEHGTAPDGMGEVKTAYLHLPMYTKVGIAEIICTQFELAQARGELVKPDTTMPDVVKLRRYIELAKEAVISGKDTYLD